MNTKFEVSVSAKSTCVSIIFIFSMLTTFVQTAHLNDCVFQNPSASNPKQHSGPFVSVSEI